MVQKPDLKCQLKRRSIMLTKEIDAYDVLENVSLNKDRWIKISQLSAEKQKLIKRIALEGKNNE